MIYLIICALGIFIWKKSYVLSSRNKNKGARAVLKLIGPVIGLTCILSFLFFEYYPTNILHPEENEVLLVKNSSGEYKPTTFGLGKFCWEWSDSYTYIPTNLELSSSVHPISGDPKVRFFRYTTIIHVVDVNKLIKSHILSYGYGSGYLGLESAYNLQKQAYDNPYFYKRNAQNINRVVTGAFNKFNNNNSKILASYYDPTDEKQYHEFASLLESKINTELYPYGIEVSFKGFTVE